jgi:hypothetical protein
LGNSLEDNITIVDTTAPELVNLFESEDPLELGNTVTIQVNVIDFSLINLVLIEIESINYTMTNIGGVTWQYNNWAPDSVGIKSYTIYAKDSSNNIISLLNNISVIENQGPTFSNLIKSADSIFLGQSVSIQVDILDISGVSEVFIEFEGSNHSMVNTGGNIWEFNDWTPNSVGEISFTIHGRDTVGNWNSIDEKIIVLNQTIFVDQFTAKEISDLILISSTFGISIIGIVLIIRTSRRKRFFK